MLADIDDSSKVGYQKWQELIELLEKLSTKYDIKSAKSIYDDIFIRLAEIKRDSEITKKQIEPIIWDYKIQELFEMDPEKEVYKQKLNELTYLQEINEDLIWNLYKKIVPYALKEAKPEMVQPETMQVLGRFNGRLFLEIQEESKETAHQQPIVDTVPKEEFDSLKKSFYDLKTEFDDLRKDNNLLRQELQSVRNDLMHLQSHETHIIQSLYDQDKDDRQDNETEIE